MLASYAKWYSFTPPQRPNFPPPLTWEDKGMARTHTPVIYFLG